MKRTYALYLVCVIRKFIEFIIIIKKFEMYAKFRPKKKRKKINDNRKMKRMLNFH